MPNRHPIWLLLVAGLSLAVLGAACSSDDEASESEPATEETEAPAATEDTEAAADDAAGAAGVSVTSQDISWKETELTATAGSVAITLTNGGQIPHTFVIDGRESDLKLEVSANGDTDSGTVDLEAGDYTYYCDVPGHRDAGMEGSLTVS